MTNQTPLNDPKVIDAVDRHMTILGRLLGEDITVSVVIQRDTKANLITNATDYAKLNIALQSIAADETKFRKIDD